MNGNVKIFGIISLMVFTLSFMLGLISSAGFLLALLRAVVSAIVFFIFLLGATWVIKLTMGDILADTEQKDDSQEDFEHSGKVNIVVGDSPGDSVDGSIAGTIVVDAPDDGDTISQAEDVDFNNLEVGNFPDLDTFSGAFDSARESRKSTEASSGGYNGDQNPELMAKAVRSFMKKDEEG